MSFSKNFGSTYFYSGIQVGGRSVIQHGSDCSRFLFCHPEPWFEYEHNKENQMKDLIH